MKRLRTRRNKQKNPARQGLIARSRPEGGPASLFRRLNPGKMPAPARGTGRKALKAEAVSHKRRGKWRSFKQAHGKKRFNLRRGCFFRIILRKVLKTCA
ncbi:hypothetical protein DPQ25_07915 [Hydrogeniiclostridium mannosilyticum]|uniref:Uncharacterized protein n=1 Tax=Hydrogeniiclostridium mannosilyticum TaxID=2764322 RepID=A0A328UET2_9FIRM|nr:hypothetical protein DPQ25_07915 [Hydrogeniiclostridium mannosilyticum]